MHPTSPGSSSKKLMKEMVMWILLEVHIFERIIKYIVARLETYAFQYGKEIEFKKFAHYDSAACILYINKFDGKIFRIDGEQMDIVDMGTDAIYFQDLDYYQPIELEPSSGLVDEVLFGNINFSKRLLSKE